MNETIYNWYSRTYPTDDMASEIDRGATFQGLFDTLDFRRDVYAYIGEGIDSIIRERCFSHLAELIDAPYDYIYEQWMLAD